MNRLRRVVGNTVISLLGQAVTWTSTIILTIAYGRFLGDVKFGELYFAITFVSLIGFPIDAGFNQQLTRDVAQDRSKALRYVSNILCFKIILWLILYGCILLLCYLLNYAVEVRTLVIICGITLLTGSIGNVMSSLHYAFEEVAHPVIGSILEKGLSALVGVILLHQGASVEVMAYVLLGSSCANMLWQTAWGLRLVGIPHIIDIPLARELLRKSIPFIVYGVLGVIYYRVDTVLLSLMTSAAVVGWYGAGYRLFDTLVFLPSLVISAIMYPVYSQLSQHSQADLKVAVEKSLNFLLFCGIPISTGMIVAAPNLIGFLYHRSDFTNAIPVMEYLAPGLLFLYINSVLTSILISTGREKKITIMAGIALVFNLGLNLLLIPFYQQVGAALVTSLTELLLLIFSMIFIPRALWPLKSLKVGAKALLAGLVMALAIWFTRQYSLLIIVPAAALVYFGVATLLGTIPRDDMRALYLSIRHKAGRSKTAAELPATTDEAAPLLADADLQPEQEFVLALGHEMTNPSLPAYKSEIWHLDTIRLPGINEIAAAQLERYQQSKLHGAKSGKIATPKIKTQLPDTPRPSGIDDEMTIKLPRFSNTSHSLQVDDEDDNDDDDATVPRMKAVGPTRGKKNK